MAPTRSQVARRAPERVIHVHLKDVDAGLADQLRSGALTFDQAVRRGLFTPLGRGAVDIAGVVEVLERSGFEGWYVLEQDTALDAEPAPGEGPVADARLSLEFLAVAGLGLSRSVYSRRRPIRMPPGSVATSRNPRCR